MCGGGGYVAGKTRRSGDWGREEHIRVQLNIERQQFSQPTEEMANARPRGLRIWYNAYWSGTDVHPDHRHQHEHQFFYFSNVNFVYPQHARKKLMCPMSIRIRDHSESIL